MKQKKEKKLCPNCERDYLIEFKYTWGGIKINNPHLKCLKCGFIINLNKEDIIYD